MGRTDRIALALMLAGTAGLGALAFRASTVDAAAPADVQATTTQARVADDAFTLFDLDATWQDQAGAPRTLQQAADGRVAVVTMLYTSCAVACPRIVADLKRIEGTLSEEQRGQVTFVIASLDPARDTPERLAQWGTDTHLDPAAWALLAGSDETVRELAAALGVRYTTMADGEVAHSNRIVVLDISGRPVHWQSGLGDVAGVEATAAAVREAINRT